MVRSSRRRFLASAGLSLLAAPFVNLLSGPARAQEAGAKRLLVFFTPNGTVHAHWRPTGGDTSLAFPVGSILEPLAGLEDRLVVIDGLDFVNASNHDPGMAAMLTNNGDTGSATGGKSLDQVVADHIGATTRFRSLELGVQTSAWGGGVSTRMSYAGPGSFVTPDDDPKSVFDRLYGDLLGSDRDKERLAVRRASVLDAVNADLASLQARLGAEERAKLDEHLTSLRAVEQQLFGETSCEPGEAPLPGNPYDNDRFPEIAKQQLDLAVEALACGITNVASVQLSHTIGPPVFSWLGVSEGHHSLSHADDANTAGVADFVTCERWFAEQFAYVVGRLEALTDPATGAPLLDDTVVLWVKEMGDGRAHVCTDVPWVIAGPGAGSWRTGRYVRANGASHAHVLVSICQAFGLDLDTFGDPSTGSGPLVELA